MQGTVKLFNDRKGYGFIQSDDNQDVFVHRNSLPTDLFITEGDQVQFEIEKTDRGNQAINIKKTSNA